MGNNLFKIAKTSSAAPFFPGFLETAESDSSLLAQFCVPEGWMGDLANGVIKASVDGDDDWFVTGIAHTDSSGNGETHSAQTTGMVHGLASAEA